MLATPSIGKGCVCVGGGGGGGGREGGAGDEVNSCPRLLSSQAV